MQLKAYAIDKHFLLLFILSLSIQNIFAFDEVDAGYHLPQFSHKIVPEFLENPVDYEQVLPKFSTSLKHENDKQRFVVKKVRIKNNTVLTRTELLPIIKNYIGNTISMSQLQQLRFEINQLYINNGYISSGVLLPDQKITDGTVVFQAIEGKLGEINVVGNKKLDNEFFAHEFESFFSNALNVKALKTHIEQLRNHPMVASIHAELLPGKQTGLSKLNISIVEYSAYQFVIGLDNYRSPGIGAERIFISANHRNTTGHADALAAQFGLTKGLKDYSLQYSLPIRSLASSVTVYYVRSDAQIIESKQSGLDIESHSRLMGLKWLWGGREGREERKALSYSTGYENINSKIDGLPSACGSKVDCQSHILFLSASWKNNYSENQKAASITLREGLDFEDKTFTAILGQYQLIQPVKKYLAMFRLNSKLQYSLDGLPGSERFSLGGVSTVRGYRENSLVRDNGLQVSGEWIRTVNLPKTYVIGFVDYGVGWNKESTPDNEHLLSIGAGISWQGIKSLNSEFFLGFPLINRADERSDLQDFGIHFSLQYQLL